MISEHSLDSDGNLALFDRVWTTCRRFGIKRSDDFDISDCTVLSPDGTCCCSRRRFSLARGIAIRIRRVPLADIRPGAVVDGRS